MKPDYFSQQAQARAARKEGARAARAKHYLGAYLIETLTGDVWREACILRGGNAAGVIRQFTKETRAKLADYSAIRATPTTNLVFALKPGQGG